MPIFDKSHICCFHPSVGVCVPQQWDIWASFENAFLIVDVMPELTDKGKEEMALCLTDTSKLGKAKKREIIENRSVKNGKMICTVQEMPRGLSFLECQFLTKAQVKAMVRPKALKFQKWFNPHKKQKGNFSHCLLWWRD